MAPAAVRVTAGELIGRDEAGLSVFRGVPYAQPPLGELRFAPPQAAEPWSGTRDAFEFGPVSVQALNPHMQQTLAMGPEPVSEDCLTLNVWTPGLDDGRRPVLFFIHGGGLTLGAGSQPVYDGGSLARRGDVVVVTMNYRLGILGFLYLAEIAGGGDACSNFGLADQVAALRWVRDEIASFGGDPDNVTIFGESAGGWAVAALLGTPSASGLFHRAVAMSGATQGVIGVEQAQAAAGEIVREFGVAEASMAALRAEPAKRFLEVQQALDQRLRKVRGDPAAGAGSPLAFSLRPVVGGNLLPRHPLEAVLGGSAAGIPVMAGTTGEEKRSQLARNPGLREMTSEQAIAAIARQDKELADPEQWARTTFGVIREALEARGARATPADVAVTAETEGFRLAAEHLLEAHAAHGPAFAYRFDWQSPRDGGAWGACHALDVPFVFGTRDLPQTAVWAGTGPEADAFEALIQDTYLNFARTGDPSGGALAEWPQFDARSRRTMLLDRECRVVERPRPEERAAMESVVR